MPAPLDPNLRSEVIHDSDARPIDSVERADGKRGLAVDASGSGGAENRDAVTFKTVTVATAGTPVQGPDVAIPDGFALVVILRETQDGSPKGYVADSSANAQSATARTEMTKGGIRTFYISNMNLLWFNTDVNGAVFELFVEQ